jgi:hypothetical protein
MRDVTSRTGENFQGLMLFQQRQLTISQGFSATPVGHLR